MDMILAIVLIAVAAAVGIAIGFISGITYRKKVAEREIGSAEAEATRIINEAIRGGESRKKEMLLEAKDEIHKSRTEYEKEVKERRAELSKQERRLEQKEATLDKKTEAFERKEEDLAKKLQKVTETQAQAEAVKQILCSLIDLFHIQEAVEFGKFIEAPGKNVFCHRTVHPL